MINIVKTKRHLFGLVSALVSALAVPSIAHGQALPDIEDTITQGSQIDDILRDQEQAGSQIVRDDTEIDGEAGIYVLRKNDIFIVGGSAGIGYSGNPLRTVDDIGDSFSVDFAAIAGIQTVLAETVDLGVRVNVSGTEYGESFAPSSRNVNGTINLGTAIEGTPVYAGVAFFGGYNFDGDFENGTAFYGVSASLNAALPLGPKTILRPNLGGARQWNETEANNNISVSAGLSVTHVVTPQLSFTASARATRTWFDDFFENVTFVKRKDWSYGGGLSANYRQNEWLNLSVSAGYQRRDSTFFLSEYDSFDASMVFSASIRF